MTSTIIIECPKCAQKLGVPSHQGALYVTCPKCREGWDWPRGRTVIPTVAAVADNTSPRGDWVACKSRSLRPAAHWVGAYISVGSLVLLAAVFLGLPELTSAPPKPLPSREVVPPKPLLSRESNVQEPRRPVWNPPPEESLPDNGDGVSRFNRAETTSKIRIVPRSEQGHIVVKVENWDDPELVCWFLIRAGQSAETSIPPGTYRLKFACGNRWYGEKHLFGPNASYFAIVNEIRVPANTVYTLNLAPSVTGRLREYTIGSTDF